MSPLYALTPVVDFTFGKPPQDAEGASGDVDTNNQPLRIEQICFNFVPSGIKDQPCNLVGAVAACDWEEIDKIAATKLDALLRVVIGFDMESDILDFANKIEPRVPYLVETNKLRYALWTSINLQSDKMHHWKACVVRQGDPICEHGFDVLQFQLLKERCVRQLY